MEQLILPDPPGFNTLSKADQIRYVQALWDRIAETPEDLPVPESHLALAEARLEDYRRDPSRARSAYDVLEELAGKTR